MKKLKTTIAVISLLSFSEFAFATGSFFKTNEVSSQPSASLASVKVGVVDVNKILSESSQVESLKKQLKKNFHNRDADILKAEKKLKSAMKKLNRDSAVMKPQARKQLQDDIVAQQKSLRTLQINFQRDLYTAKEKGMNKILGALKSTIETVSHNKGVNLVLTKNGLAFFESNYDITDAVAKAFKDKKSA